MDSREGDGSVFTVSLPVPVADPEKVAEEREKAETGLPDGLCVLAIDDDGVLLNVIERQLELAGAHCDTCRTPGGMIGLLRKRRYNLLLTDIRMPGMNGYRLLELLRNSNVGNSRELPVLAVTAHVAKKESDFVKAGFAGCLYKPFSAEELYAAIRTVLARHGEDGYKEEKTELDFSPLLVKEENGRAMLGILAGQTRKDMEALEEAVRRRDRPALADITHHLLPVWTLLRAEKSLHRLRSSYRQEPPDWDGIAAAAKDVADTGRKMRDRQNGRRRLMENKARILVIEDNPVYARMLSNWLRPLGYGTVVAASAYSARKAITEDSTLFLDEVGNLPHDVQRQLLRALQERVYRPVGDTVDRECDIRVIAATNENLERAIREGRFREDLFYRLNEFSVHVPPLRECREDILHGAKHGGEHPRCPVVHGDRAAFPA